MISGNDQFPIVSDDFACDIQGPLLAGTFYYPFTALSSSFFLNGIDDSGMIFHLDAEVCIISCQLKRSIPSRQCQHFCAFLLTQVNKAKSQKTQADYGHRLTFLNGCPLENVHQATECFAGKRQPIQ